MDSREWRKGCPEHVSWEMKRLFQSVILKIIAFGSLAAPFNDIDRSGGWPQGARDPPLLLSSLEQKARVSAD